MILLTDPEILKALNTMAPRQGVVFECDRNLTREQARKIAKWGDGECPHGKMLRRECYDCWQVLREVV